MENMLSATIASAGRTPAYLQWQKTIPPKPDDAKWDHVDWEDWACAFEMGIAPSDWLAMSEEEQQAVLHEWYKTKHPDRTAPGTAYHAAVTFLERCKIVSKTEQTTQQARDVREKIASLYRQSGIPANKRAITFDRCTWPDDGRADRIKEVFDELSVWVPERGGKGLLFQGDIGTGKTHLLYCIANRLITEERIAVRFVPFMEFADRVTDGYPSDRRAYFDDLCRTEVLILDDLGRAAADYTPARTPWVAKTFRLIDTRDRHDLVTLYATNLPTEGTRSNPGLLHTLGKACVSRIVDRSVVYGHSCWIGPNRRAEDSLNETERIANDAHEQPEFPDWVTEQGV